MLDRRLFFSLIVLASILPLSGCDSEEKQAQAFADFLQTRMLDRPGVHIPILSDEERAAIGHFEADFEIIKGFNDDLTATARGVRAIRPPPQMRSPLELSKYRVDLNNVRAFFPRAGVGIEAALAKAQEAHAKLRQPAVVQVKFDAAFDQMVTAPANALREIIPLTAPALDDEIALADFIEAHKADLKAVGGSLQATKPELRKEMQSIVDDYVARMEKVTAARRKLERAVQGY